jgi:hypothetical protein
MPLICIDMFRGKTPEYRTAMRDAVCRALGDVLGVPAGECQAVIIEHDFESRDDPTTFVALQGVSDAILVQIVFAERPKLDQRQILYSAILQALSRRLGLEIQYVALNLFEANENRHFGDVARYLEAHPR